VETVWISDQAGKRSLERSDDFAYPCPACLEKIQVTPAPIRKSTERILIGDVI
jgi:hypothetical protein